MSIRRTFATIAFILGAVGLSQSSNAQTGSAPQGPPNPGTPVVVGESQVESTATGAQTHTFFTVLSPDPTDPEHATDRLTGRNFHWDPDKKTWVNSQTGQSVNFAGYLTPSGPPGTPLVIGESQVESTATGAQSHMFFTVLSPDPSDPEHATDRLTGRNFNWDQDRGTWVNSQTGQTVNFAGYLTVSPAPSQPPTPSAMPRGSTNVPVRHREPAPFS